MDYDSAAVVAPIASLMGELELTSAPNWGYALRRGLLVLSDADMAVIARAMGVAPGG